MVSSEIYLQDLNIAFVTSNRKTNGKRLKQHLFSQQEGQIGEASDTLFASISAGCSHGHKIHASVPRVTWKKNPVEEEGTVLLSLCLFSLSGNKSPEALQLPSLPVLLANLGHMPCVGLSIVHLASPPPLLRSPLLWRRKARSYICQNPLSYGSRLECVNERHPLASVMERSLSSSQFEPELWVDTTFLGTSGWVLKTAWSTWFECFSLRMSVMIFLTIAPLGLFSG